MERDSLQKDIVIAGAGMAGLVAAVRALEEDVDVLILEKAPRPGGSMYISSGQIYTYDSEEIVHEKVPDGDPALQSLVVREFHDSLDWLSQKGIELKEPFSSRLPDSTRKQIEPPEFTEHMLELVDAGGGQLRLETPLRSLWTNEVGDLRGVIARRPEGAPLRIEAKRVILATGGFQGNEELVERYITEHTNHLWLRSNPWSSGDGLLAAQDIGAKLTDGMGTFYGHNMAAPPAEFSPLEYTDASQYYGPFAIAIDSAGRRFTDETETNFEEVLVQDTAKLANGQAWYVFDNDLYHEEAINGRRISAIVERAAEYGAPVAKTDSLDDLGDALKEWGVNGRQAVKTVSAFNRAVREGTTGELHPPRRRYHRTFDSPPFYAVKVQPGITFTMGGLAVSETGQVLRRTGTSTTLPHFPERYEHVLSEPIEGLFAAGADVGNIHHRHYLGGLATALVTGLQAARHAVKGLQ